MHSPNNWKLYGYPNDTCVVTLQKLIDHWNQLEQSKANSLRDKISNARAIALRNVSIYTEELHKWYPTVR